MNQNRIIVAQLGARMHYAVPKVFHKAGLLERLYTDLFIPPGSFSARLATGLLPRRLAGKLKRNNPGLPPALVRSNNLHGLITKIRLRQARSPLAEFNVHDQAARWLAQRVAADNAQTTAGLIYGFEIASLELFRWAKPRNFKLILEQCIAPRQTHIATLGKLFAAAGLPASDAQIEAWQRLARREEAEWQLADVILCPSEYVLEELKRAGAPPAKLRLVPYAVDGPSPDKIEPVLQSRVARSRDKLRVLFVGAVGLRKGALELISAAQKLDGNHFEFVAAGRLDLPASQLAAFHASIRHLGNLSPEQLAMEYAEADCFVLPSHLEGSATVVYEALAWGLPVVTTRSAGTVVEDGVSGFVGQAGEVDFLVSSLKRLRNEAGLLSGMATNAWKRSQAFNLDAYQRRLLEALAQTASS